MACADDLLEILKAWKQATQFADAEDWIFAGTVKLGHMPVGYTSVWREKVVQRALQHGNGTEGSTTH